MEAKCTQNKEDGYRVSEKRQSKEDGYCVSEKREAKCTQSKEDVTV